MSRLTLVTCASRDEGGKLPRADAVAVPNHFPEQQQQAVQFGCFVILLFCPGNLSPCKRTEPFKRPKTLHACNSCPCAWKKQVRPPCLPVGQHQSRRGPAHSAGWVPWDATPLPLGFFPLHCVHCDHLLESSCLVQVRVAPTSYLHGCLALGTI